MTVDDHQILQMGIKFLLLAFDDIELVAEALSGEEALRLCGEAQPDVILMDVMMPNMDGLATTQAIREQCPHAQVVILTSFQSNALVQQATQAGAIGYLLKGVPIDDIAVAIRTAAQGRPALCPEAAQALIQAANSAGGPTLGQDLTDRQHEVLALMVEGLSNNDIAKRLILSPSTIRHHVSEVLSKLHAANRAEAAALAVRHNLVHPPKESEGSAPDLQSAYSIPAYAYPSRHTS
ncbi:MAG: response regulator transcription factor [Anaerolineae bacterium]|nr:response regulator transcription factor [Anaerolineae bacterium]